jgi:dihydroxyacid dehydratase/phosphogluconate dehydratase
MNPLLDSGDATLYEVVTAGPGPQGKLPLTDELLRNQPSGHAFGMSQDAGMGWKVSAVDGPQYVLLSTLGGVRADDGTPIALGYHTGHWELVLALKAAAEEIKNAGGIPYAAHCTDPCDGRTQGTTGMFDSLAYRNDAASVLRRLTRSIPRAKGVLGVATCDKGLPAMMMALASFRDIPSVLIPGGVMLPVREGEDTALVQSIGVRYANGESRWKKPRWPAATLAPRAAAVATSSAPRPRRRSWEKLWVSPCRTLLSPHPLNRSGSTWPGAVPWPCSLCKNAA